MAPRIFMHLPPVSFSLPTRPCWAVWWDPLRFTTFLLCSFSCAQLFRCISSLFSSYFAALSFVLSFPFGLICPFSSAAAPCTDFLPSPSVLCSFFFSILTHGFSQESLLLSRGEKEVTFQTYPVGNEACVSNAVRRKS